MRTVEGSTPTVREVLERATGRRAHRDHAGHVPGGPVRALCVMGVLTVGVVAALIIAPAGGA